MLQNKRLIGGIAGALFVIAMLVGMCWPLYAPHTAQATNNVNLMDYWNFQNCKWQIFHNYKYTGDPPELTLVNNGTNYKTWTREWITRCPNGDHDPCGTDTDYVRWNVKAESDACYWGTNADNEDLVFYFERNATTQDYIHPAYGITRTVVAAQYWVEMDNGGGWDWTLCGDPDPPDDDYESDKVRRLYGKDGPDVLPLVYTPASWDFDKGAWVYCTHATHQKYASTPSGICSLTRSDDDPYRVDWCVVVDYLGWQNDFGTSEQYDGYVVRVTQFEGAYKLDESTIQDRVSWDVVEEWYLMKDVGIVEIRQWQNGEHKVTAKLHDSGYSSDDDQYCRCCSNCNFCNQNFYDSDDCITTCP